MIERIYLQIKGMRTMFAVPLLMYFLFIPFSVWLLSGKEEVHVLDAATQVCYLLVPILSTWWLYILQREYIEGDGREVLRPFQVLCKLKKTSVRFTIVTRGRAEFLGSAPYLYYTGIFMHVK